MKSTVSCECGRAFLAYLEKSFCRLVCKPGAAAKGGIVSWIDDPAATWNAHSRRGMVVKGALCAALYPQVACMEGDTTSTRRPTWLATDLQVALHPSSVLHPLLASQFQSPYVVFSEKMQTSTVYLRELSVVPPMALLLFGGQLEVHHDAGYIIMDSWLKVRYRFPHISELSITYSSVVFLNKMAYRSLGWYSLF
jgi:hypothetical protein